MTDEELIKKYVPKNKQKRCLKKLKTGYPVQYLIGSVEFYNKIIFVNKRVLIPRFETEFLVEKIIKLIQKYEINNPSILDLCTGSGCIAIALNSNNVSQIDAIDISRKSLKVAKKNAKYNNAKINFKRANLETYIPNKKYTIIVSNPPYVSKKEKVDPKVKYEPEQALYAPLNCLYYYDIIFKRYKEFLNNKFLLAFEIGATQKEDLIKMAEKYYKGAKITVEQDLCGKDRYLFITNFE